VDGEEGLRERKRRETRALIARTAMPLFIRRGFDAVSVAEIAAAAGVAEKTVYNYFPVKAAMFFDEADSVLAELLAAVRYRAPGQSAVDAVGTFIAGRGEWAAGRRPEQPTGRFRQLIDGSPALQAQQRLMFAAFETALAEMLADETGVPRGAVEPFVAAVALVGVIRAAFEASPGGAEPGRDMAAAALSLLSGGLSGYAVRPGSGASAASAAASNSARAAAQSSTAAWASSACDAPK
jgi:AcrR family transcriptional regulator